MAAPPGSSSSSNSRLQQMLQSAVQAVQWTYSLFWQVCPQQGILVWGDGYYNGAIKTRKTVQPMEVTAEEASLQRSQQLRELYDSLSAEETNQPARRPCAALSPEDLTESEWFYLMSVSFSFPPGVGLPGKAFARQQHVWLLGANEADSKIFSRAILAKSAGVQTVLCIPLMDGVVELGTTERVQEDLGFIQHIKSFFVDPHHHQLHHHPKPAHSEHSTSTPTAAASDRSGRFHSPSLIAAYRGSTPHPPSSINTVVNDEEEDDEEEDDDEEEEEDEDAESNSEVETGRNSHPFCSQPELHPIPLDNHPMNQPLPAKPSELMQIDMSEDIRLGSPDDASNNFESDLQLVVVSQHGRQTDLQTRSESAHRWSFLPSQLDNGLQPPVSESLQIEELTQDDDDTDHYSLTVSTILQHSSSRWSESSSVNYAGHSSHNSSAFSKWTDRADDHHVVPVNTVSGASSSSSQSLLKHILFSVPYLHVKHMTTTPMTTARLRKSASQDEFGSASHVLAERRRREKLNERFITLRSLVPFVTKMDKASILGDTIEYVKQLRRRIQDLESRGEQQRSWRGGERKKMRLAEEGGGGGGKSKVVEGAPNLGSVVQVSIIESDALLELKCAYRESILLEIIQALWELGMEIVAVQSSSANGVFVAELRAKVKENGSGRKATISEVKREMYQIISQTS